VKIQALECDQCGSREIRRARLQGFSERMRAILGIYPFRCRDCQNRFFVSVWLLSRLAFAKCPKCLRMELSTWSRRFYNPGVFANLLITFGGQKYRCSGCRCNFVSFRPRRVAGLSGKSSVDSANPDSNADLLSGTAGAN
jgi:predicted nucleic acid-binding Zn ribbon protein